ncbi:MAG TPA: phenylalanine--tRNA ligase subunit alpha [Patescibacteria group bacterium]|nr:phenylalanine--tRNA ligase subunit alpha [Patescibacteria group bacterium]
MLTQVQNVLEAAQEAIKTASSQEQLEKNYIDLFGKKGKFTELSKSISKIPSEQKAEFGKSLNQAKQQILAGFEKQKKEILSGGGKQKIDITAPGKRPQIGHLHLVSQAIDEIVDIFKRIGFSLKSYPEVDWDWYAFESLNMPKDHPARDEWETFFVKSKRHATLGNQVLTPHTSNGQVREMKRVKNPPIRMLNISRCYRRQVDVSHTPMFHQFEGMLIDKNVAISNLKGTLDYFARKFFGKERKSRLRPHHFRFTEPSFEVDVTCGVCLGHGCRFCKSGWVELGGAGMVHPNVIKAGGLDPKKYTGFAFGWGVERTIAMRTEIGDIRLLFQNDIRFLEQF